MTMSLRVTLKRFDGQAQELLKARKQKTSRALPRPPKPLSIKPLQFRYYAQLRHIALDLRAIINESILPFVDSIIEEAKRARPKVDSRNDAYDDTIQQIISLAKIQFLRKYPESFYRDLATKMAASTSALNLDNINRTFQKLFGAEYSRFEPWITQEVKRFTRENVKLITKINSESFERVESVLLRGAQAGKLSKDVAKEIKAQFGVSDRRAAFIARDQIAKFNGDLTKLRQTNAGITKYQWSTSGDERVRDSHADNDGKIFPWSDPPAPATGDPGFEFNCRCVALPVLDD